MFRTVKNQAQGSSIELKDHGCGDADAHIGGRLKAVTGSLCR